MANFISHLSHGLSLTYWQTLLNALRNEFNCCLKNFIIQTFSVTKSDDAADVSIEFSFAQNCKLLAK